MQPQRYKINRKQKDSAAVTNGLPTKRCCRPSIQGNIFKVGEVATFRETYFADQVKLKDPELHKKCYIDCCKINQTEAVALHKLYMEMLKEYEIAKFQAIVKPCKDKNLGCFCDLDEPCHVDYLFKNSKRMKAKEWLEGIRKFMPDIVAVTKDKRNQTTFHTTIPIIFLNEYWTDTDGNSGNLVEIPITFDSEDWRSCIITTAHLGKYVSSKTTINESKPYIKDGGC